MQLGFKYVVDLLHMYMIQLSICLSLTQIVGFMVCGMLSGYVADRYGRWKVCPLTGLCDELKIIFRNCFYWF